ncbi:uncharacterized protein LOC103505084, partial [Diaphorina citri]|uniref:Uncharacterized protein LOC103505084 n=1 Tax=Diaphorina citri TaxID=121845 RepID=A0A1S3CTR0_DIACI
RQYSSTTEPGILPPQEEQKYRENIGALKQILKGHQIDKPLPEKVTADNIDSSIDTLTTILKVLQKNPGAGSLAVPPVGAGPVKNQHFPYTGSLDNSLTFNNHYPGNIHTQTYDGSTPGRPGVDYPILSQIPQTQFDCKTQRYKGFFGDPETDCQVWHYCDLNGGQASFLCPNGTIFNQVALTCDWWFNVQCNSTAQLYVLNERLYKFIIPTKPSFPEDYAGPAVDEYLKAKYYELEAKRKPSNETTFRYVHGTADVEVKPPSEISMMVDHPSTEVKHLSMEEMHLCRGWVKVCRINVWPCGRQPCRPAPQLNPSSPTIYTTTSYDEIRPRCCGRGGETPVRNIHDGGSSLHRSETPLHGEDAPL